MRLFKLTFKKSRATSQEIQIVAESEINGEGIFTKANLQDSALYTVLSIGPGSEF